jgi:hypothetical protein
MVGTPIAAIFTSSVYMAVINASAMALVDAVQFGRIIAEIGV